MYVIIYSVLIFFVLTGVVATVYSLMLLLTHPKAKGHFVVVIPPMAPEAEVASLLCAARLRVGLLGDISRSVIIALDCGMPAQTRLQCEALCRELNHTMLLTPEEFLTTVTKISTDST
ncbi:MAG: hypothetical protein LBG83_05240 [Oscillospiraceae bacterium]|jgi:hypothetical protein|nr:hypothetical protein [Oscillospiraceae bacterium]